MFEGGQQEPIGTLVVFFLGNSSCRSPIRQTLLQTRPRFENCCFANSAYFRNNHFHSWEELKIFGDPAAFFCRWGTEMWADQVTCWGHVVHLWQNSEPRVWPSVFWSPGPALHLASGDVVPLGVSSLLSIMEGEPSMRRGQNSSSSWPMGVTGRHWDEVGVRESSLEPNICRDDEVHFLIHINNNKLIWGRNWTCGQFCKEVSQPKHL